MAKRAMTPPINDEAYEKKLTSLALAQVQSQLEDKTASSQVLTHFLKLASQRSSIELKKLELESQLIEAKINSEQSGEQLKEMITEVLAALTTYSYKPPEEL